MYSTVQTKWERNSPNFPLCSLEKFDESSPPNFVEASANFRWTKQISPKQNFAPFFIYSGWSTSGSSVIHWRHSDTRAFYFETANLAGHNPSRKHFRRAHAYYTYIVLKNNQVLEFLFTTVRVNETLFNYTDSCSFKNCSFFNSSTFGGLLTSDAVLFFYCSFRKHRRARENECGAR